MVEKDLDLAKATRVDAYLHAIVSVVYLLVIMILGITKIIDGAGVIGMIVGGGSIVTALSVGDAITYKPNKGKRYG